MLLVILETLALIISIILDKKFNKLYYNELFFTSITLYIIVEFGYLVIFGKYLGF